MAPAGARARACFPQRRPATSCPDPLLPNPAMPLLPPWDPSPQPTLDIPVYGRISAMRLFKPQQARGPGSAGIWDCGLGCGAPACRPLLAGRSLGAAAGSSRACTLLPAFTRVGLPCQLSRALCGAAAPQPQPSGARELLFVLTEHYRFFVLAYDAATGARAGHHPYAKCSPPSWRAQPAVAQGPPSARRLYPVLRACRDTLTRRGMCQAAHPFVRRRRSTPPPCALLPLCPCRPAGDQGVRRRKRHHRAAGGQRAAGVCGPRVPRGGSPPVRRPPQGHPAGPRHRRAGPRDVQHPAGGAQRDRHGVPRGLRRAHGRGAVRGRKARAPHQDVRTQHAHEGGDARLCGWAPLWCV